MPPNDLSIPDDARLLRRVIPQWIVNDDNTNSKRVTSQAFCNSTGEAGQEEGMSVFLEDVILNEGRSVSSLLTNYETNALIAITAGWVRSWQQGVVRDPISEESSHAQVMGDKNSNTRRKLAKEWVWVIEPK